MKNLEKINLKFIKNLLTKIILILIAWYILGFKDFIIACLFFTILFDIIGYFIVLKMYRKRTEVLEDEKNKLIKELDEKYKIEEKSYYNDLSNYSIEYTHSKRYYNEFNFRGNIEELAYFFNTSIINIFIKLDYSKIEKFNSRNISTPLKVFKDNAFDFLYSTYIEKINNLKFIKMTDEEKELLNNIIQNPEKYKIKFTTKINHVGDSHIVKYLPYEDKDNNLDFSIEKSVFLTEKQYRFNSYSEEFIKIKSDLLYDSPDILTGEDIVNMLRLNLIKVEKI